MSIYSYRKAITPEQMPVLSAGFRLSCVAIRESSARPSLPLPIESQHRLAAFLITLVQDGETDVAALAIAAVAHQQNFMPELGVH